MIEGKLHRRGVDLPMDDEATKRPIKRPKIEKKFQAEALHPLRFSTLLHDFARFGTLLNAVPPGRPAKVFKIITSAL
jgi:hypothetical protein